MTPGAVLLVERHASTEILGKEGDECLVQCVRAGSARAFEAIVARYNGPLLSYCRRFLSRERAEDVVQQTFLSAHQAILRDDSAFALRPWLYRVAHNGAIDSLRDRSLRHEQIDERIDGVERPDEAFERHLSFQEAIAAVRALPERQRDALVLRELEGRTYEYIADEMGLSGGAVRQLLSRARTKLRQGTAALTPSVFLSRLWASSVESLTARSGELAGPAGGALAVKLGAVVLATGGLVGGVAAVPAIRSHAGQQSSVGTSAAPHARSSESARGSLTHLTRHGRSRGSAKERRSASAPPPVSRRKLLEGKPDHERNHPAAPAPPRDPGLSSQQKFQLGPAERTEAPDPTSTGGGWGGGVPIGSCPLANDSSQPCGQSYPNGPEGFGGNAGPSPGPAGSAPGGSQPSPLAGQPAQPPDGPDQGFNGSPPVSTTPVDGASQPAS